MAEPSPTAQPPLRIGTRRSNLAVVQAEGIRDSLKKIAPDLSYEIQALRTLGDKDKSTALYNFEGKNLWTTELEEKLNSGELDVIVHCLKDMPTKLPDSCELAAIPLRDDPRDALIVKASLPYTSLATLPQGAVVGTSSVRRSAQLRRLYPHLRFANLRGNVDTRLAKVDDPNSEYICMIMSAAGLERIGLKHRINQYLGSKDGGILHAVGQGALGLEIRKGDTKMRDLLGRLADRKSTLAGIAERSLMKTLEGGCSVPIGVETEWLESGDLRMRAIVVSLDGAQSVQDTIDMNVQNVDEATALGQALAARLAKAGAEAILNDIVANRPAKE
ncbi:porphobilinogen deaminase [Aspergillus candidus]|uniref:Porphobilinogen deaminase n=1 Tax=Aspergillus candidus TaxID=41067 RepID=A0A2I2F6W9_ASPCN|nr:putative porphobilinogen deaminase Hem3 [Aspergillus candidus]PLB36385.1 putative porphobilinogen deaminase Hem3 [Aspergillus candidus]